MEITPAIIETVEALPTHQLCLRRLAEMGLSTEASLALALDARLSSAMRNELTAAVGFERVERYRQTLALEGFATAIDRLIALLAKLPQLQAQPAQEKRKTGPGPLGAPPAARRS